MLCFEVWCVLLFWFYSKDSLGMSCSLLAVNLSITVASELNSIISTLYSFS